MIGTALPALIRRFLLVLHCFYLTRSGKVPRVLTEKRGGIDLDLFIPQSQSLRRLLGGLFGIQSSKLLSHQQWVLGLAVCRRHLRGLGQEFNLLAYLIDIHRPRFDYAHPLLYALVYAFPARLLRHYTPLVVVAAAASLLLAGDSHHLKLLRPLALGMNRRPED